MIDSKTLRILKRLRDTEADSFEELLRITELDPAHDFRNVDLRNVNFGDANLEGFDFTLADLTGADLSRARTHNATFNRTTLNHVKWRRSARHLKRLWKRDLPEFHLDVVKDVVGFTAKKTKLPNVSLNMPAGSGKLGLLSAILEAYDDSELLRDVLVVVGSVVEGESVREALASFFGPDVAQLASSKKDKRDNQRIEIVTSSALKILMNAPERSALRLSSRINCVVSYGADRKRASEHRGLRKFFEGSSLVTFEMDWSFDKGAHREYDMAFRYEIADAVHDEALEKARRIRVSPESDVVEILREQPAEAYGVIIVNNKEGLGRLADRIDDRLAEETFAWRLVPLKAAGMAGREGLGGVVHIIQVASAIDHDLSDADFVIVTTRLPYRLAQRLAYPRVVTSRIREVAVYDMEGSVAGLPEETR